MSKPARKRDHVEFEGQPIQRLDASIIGFVIPLDQPLHLGQTIHITLTATVDDIRHTRTQRTHRCRVTTAEYTPADG